MIDPKALAELARLMGTAPANLAGLAAFVPTSPTDLRRLARRLGVDPESLRAFADDALQPLTGFDEETRRLLRLWQKLDPKRREAALVVMKDLAAASGRPARRKRAGD